MTSRLAAISIFILLVCSVLDARDLGLLLLQTEVGVSGQNEGLLKWNKAIALVNLQNEELSIRGEHFFEELVAAELFRIGVPADAHGKKWVSAFEKKDLPLVEATSPKLVFDIQLKRSSDIDYQSIVTVTLVEYRRETVSTPFRPQRSWYKQQSNTAGTRHELSDALVRSIQSAIHDAVPILKKVTKKPEVQLPREDRITGTKGSHSAVSYSTRWVDPDPRRGKLFVGASIGTPALVNLHFGYWGTRSLPLIASISGMYLNNQNRGFQADIGWALDNEGNFKHGFGFNMAWLPTTKVSQSQKTDVIGRVYSIETTVETNLSPHLGAGYFFDLNWFRLQIGAAVPAFNPGSSLRILFQVGFIPPVSF